ncbi:fimbrial protein [Erwinia sp. JUb26]|uniref:fimbrial protein n=1 Tax=Erwinia sp. JUb26 TaxID=2485126 RepID=UPI000F482EB4|nr:fimbrial protein [Erwinia sp. JUb26]ROR08830.1 type 1 fimbria pilin [Erwinia sp. JUb26]
MFKKISVLVLLLNMSAVSQGYSSGLMSSDNGQGRVNMIGSIIDAACAIDINSIDQTIDMGVVPVSRIVRDGQSVKKNFSINLINCVLNKSDKDSTRWQYFTITFDGLNDDGLFSVEGDAKGIAIKIIDNSGSIARPGLALPPGKIESGDISLNFSMQLVSNHRALQAGDYNAVIKFKMDYY